MFFFWGGVDFKIWEIFLSSLFSHCQAYLPGDFCCSGCQLWAEHRAVQKEDFRAPLPVFKTWLSPPASYGPLGSHCLTNLDCRARLITGPTLWGWCEGDWHAACAQYMWALINSYFPDSFAWPHCVTTTFCTKCLESASQAWMLNFSRLCICHSIGSPWIPGLGEYGCRWWLKPGIAFCLGIMIYCLETERKHCQPVSRLPGFFTVSSPLVPCSPLHLVKQRWLVRAVLDTSSNFSLEERKGDMQTLRVGCGLFGSFCWLHRGVWGATLGKRSPSVPSWKKCLPF